MTAQKVLSYSSVPQVGLLDRHGLQAKSGKSTVRYQFPSLVKVFRLDPNGNKDIILQKMKTVTWARAKP